MAVRLTALFLAALSDILDGFAARRLGTVSRFGAMLDPLMDKFFLFFVLGVLTTEGFLSLWQLGAFLTRDLFLIVFGLFLLISGEWRNLKFRSFVWGKVTTIIQYIGLFLVVIGIALPLYFTLLLFAFGTLFFVELFLIHRQII